MQNNTPNLYYLHVTFKCNWRCDYCSEGTHTRDRINFDDIQRDVALIPNGVEVIISGGEPGVVPAEILHWVFDQLEAKSCVINVNTNGAFFTMHPDLCSRVSNFLYHCSEHLEEEEIYIPNFVDPDKIDYLLVVTDQTMPRIEYYINKYPDITFTLFGATATYYNRRGVGASLSRANGFKVYKEFKDRINPISYMHLISRSQETIDIQKIKVLQK